MPLYFILILVSFVAKAMAQQPALTPPAPIQKQHSLDLWLGFHLQGNMMDGEKAKTLNYLELGIGRGQYIFHRHGIAGKGFYFSEKIIVNSPQRIFGSTIGYFMHAWAALGLSATYYTDFEKGNLKLRPEIGWGMGRMALLLGFNLPTFANRAMPALQKQNAQLIFRAGFGVQKKNISGASPADVSTKTI